MARALTTTHCAHTVNSRLYIIPTTHRHMPMWSVFRWFPTQPDRPIKRDSWRPSFRYWSGMKKKRRGLLKIKTRRNVFLKIDSHQKPRGVHVCVGNIHFELKDGGSLQQPREPFARGSVVTTQEGSSSHHLSYKSQKKWSRTSRTGNLAGKKEQDQRFLLFKIIKLLTAMVTDFPNKYRL